MFDMEKKLEQLLTQMEKEFRSTFLLFEVIKVGEALIMQYKDILQGDADEQTPVWHTEHRLRRLREAINIFGGGMGIELPENSMHTRDFKNKVVTHMSDMLTAMERMDELRYTRAKKRFADNVPKYHSKAVNEFRKRKELLYSIVEQAYSIDAEATAEKLIQLEM